MTTNPATLPEIGEALYGARWVAPLARALGVSLRLAWYWRTGEREPDEAIMNKLRGLLEEQIKRLIDLAER